MQFDKKKSKAGQIPVFAKEVRKRYGKEGSYTDALTGVDLQIKNGEIVAVLGPNGAGKTTLIEILEGLRLADAGRVQILGQDVHDAEKIKKLRYRMGISAQNSVLPPLLTVEELLSLHANLFPNSQSVDRLIDELGLREKCDTRIKHLSGGQQQRVTIALALIGDPELIFLDEPTSQLDPQARRAVWAVLNRQRERRNATILITTHQMEEAQRFCDRVMVLDHGKVLVEGEPASLVEQFCPERVVEFVSPKSSNLQFLNDSAIKIRETFSSAQWRVHTTSANGLVSELISRQSRGELEVEDIRVDKQSLEDVFIQLTGRGIRN
ncbi:ABC transporter ATP-binding protein [Microbulbifer sp. 2205BS26-8]|uniref:ABC transporter ATP-binding protein n=1 Tax=Microbulbifer sp. 2205BS26-8 TaxID=3064386 RepID=UPI00273E6C22|nr:ABC transporter ATP-binding protein [Microbulbifer sp. 2205BS26-8]MDP5210775.1 ABC transporter ATP-binding protein [Microbulbifer sp. 2205BS26-8]